MKQIFQDVEGRIKLGGRELPIREARLDGDRIAFSGEAEAGRPVRQFEGRIRGDAIEGRFHGAGAEGAWSATRMSGGKAGG